MPKRKKFTREQLEVLAPSLIREEPEIAKASMARSLLYKGMVREPQDAVLIAEDVFAELAANKFDLAFGDFHEEGTDQLLEIYIGFDQGRKSLFLYIIARAHSGYAELYPQESPGERFARRARKKASARLAA